MPARLYGTIAIVAGTFVSVLGSAVLNVPLGRIAHDLHVSIAGASLLITGQALTFAVLLPLADWVGARFGRRNVYAIAIAALSVTGFICPFATTLPLLVAMRIIQGIAAALIVPSCMTLLTELYTADQRPLALSAWATANSAGQALGPPLGGLLTAVFGWRSVFLPAAVISLLACPLALRFLPADAPQVRSLEWRGAILLTAGAFFLLAAFIAIPQLGASSPLVLGLAAGGICCAIGFVISIRDSANPFVSPRAFAQPTYRTSCIGVFAATLVLGSTMLTIPLYLTLGVHVPIAAAGFITLTLPLTMAIVAPFSSRAIARYGSGRTMQAGLLALVAGGALLASMMTLGAGLIAIFPAMILVGGAIAAQYTAGAVGSTHTEAGRYGAGVGFFNLLRLGGSAVGAALVAIVLRNDENAYVTVFAVTATFALAAFVATLFSERGGVNAKPA